MRIAITGGGTGGHLSIAKSLGAECRRRGFYTMYIGSTSGQDKQWFESNDIFDCTLFLESKPVVNQNLIKKFSNLYGILSQSLIAKRTMIKENIQACISVGGFSAATGGFGALFAKIPLFIHEQNAYMGSLNRILSPFAKQVFSSFELPNIKNLTIMPYPVNNIFFEKRRIREKLNNIAFMGGSQGARAINNFALSIAQTLAKKGIKILHQTGKMEYEKVILSYKEMGFTLAQNLDEFRSGDFEAFVFDFSTQLHEVMSLADFCISRSGASSLWELVANGLPTLFIPYPHAALNHQYFNAKILKDKNLCLLCLQEDLEAKSTEILENIFSFDLSKTSGALLDSYNGGGSEDVIDYIVK